MEGMMLDEFLVSLEHIVWPEDFRSRKEEFKRIVDVDLHYRRVRMKERMKASRPAIRVRCGIVTATKEIES
jgi:hypothetical protein